MKNYIILSLIYIIVFSIKWQSFPMYIDEFSSTYISNGVWAADINKFNQITEKEIRENNTIGNVIKCTLSDGGNAPLYYLISHYTSITIGKFIGVFNSLRLLSNLFSLTLVLMFFAFIKREFNTRIAFINSLLLIFLLIQFGDYIRTYPVSNFFVFLFFQSIYKIVENVYNEKPMRNSQYIYLITFGSVMPFFHYFNIFYPVVCIALLTYLTKFKLSINKTKYILISLTIPILLFSIYYFLNAEGRSFQSYLNDYWYDYAQKYGTPENSWLAPTNTKYLVLENNENLLSITGLDLRLAFPQLRMLYFSIILLIPAFFIFYVIKTSAKYKIKGNNLLIMIILANFASYIIFLNLICILSGHTTALNSTWYSSSTTVLFSFVITHYLFISKSKFSKYLFRLYLFIVITNTLIYLININTRINPMNQDSTAVDLLQKIENQFK